MPGFSGPSSCSQQWVPGDASEWLRIGKAFVRVGLSTFLDSTSYFKVSWARCCFHVILGVFLFQIFVPSSFGPAESWICIIFSRGTVEASFRVSQKITHCLFNNFNGIFKNSKLTSFLKIHPKFHLLWWEENEGSNKVGEWRRVAMTVELMFGVSIPYIVFSTNWKIECFNPALITKGGTPLVAVHFPKCCCLDPWF